MLIIWFWFYRWLVTPPPPFLPSPQAEKYELEVDEARGQLAVTLFGCYLKAEAANSVVDVVSQPVVDDACVRLEGTSHNLTFTYRHIQAYGFWPLGTLCRGN